MAKKKPRSEKKLLNDLFAIVDKPLLKTSFADNSGDDYWHVKLVKLKENETEVWHTYIDETMKNWVFWNDIASGINESTDSVILSNLLAHTSAELLIDADSKPVVEHVFPRKELAEAVHEHSSTLYVDI